MSGTKAPVAIGPKAYACWRATALGTITEALELEAIFELIGEIRGARVLDVGCGDGALSCAAALRGAHVTGVDPDPEMLTAARMRAARAGVVATFAEGRGERLPFTDASFDVVTAVTVLCFVRDASAALREMGRVLRPGGSLVIGELGRFSSWAAIRRLRGWLGSPTWKTARFRSAAELRALADEAGFCAPSMRGAIFYPPAGPFARLMAPIDPWLGRRTTVGAAFIALRAVTREPERR